MKKNVIHLFTLLSVALVMVSCQKEKSEFIDQTNKKETITATSALSSLLRGASQNPGKRDNIIDGNSCSQVKFPITVIANGQQLILKNATDLALVQAVFNQFPTDEDTLEIIFPIRVILRNFSEKTLRDQDALEDLAEACQESKEIACVDFVYPMTLFTYDTQQEQSGVVVIESDKELYLLFLGLEEEELVSIDFPISVELPSGTKSVNSNEELEAILDFVDCEGDDDEDDDFSEDLTSGSWYVTYYFDDYDNTADFGGYELSFATDNSIKADNGADVVSGNWHPVTGEDSAVMFSFGTGAPFDGLAHNWEITEASSDFFQLRYVDENDGSVDYLTFERDPNLEGSNDTVNDLIRAISTGAWTISLFVDEGDKTSNYAGYDFTFSINSSVKAVGAAGTTNGFWQVKEVEGGLEIILKFDTSSNDYFKDLNDSWTVQESLQTVIRLSDNGDDSDTDLLTFEKN